MYSSSGRPLARRVRELDPCLDGVCVLSELHDFAPETTSGAVDRSRDTLESDLRPFDGLCALRAS